MSLTSIQHEPIRAPPATDDVETGKVTHHTLTSCETLDDDVSSSDHHNEEDTDGDVENEKGTETGEPTLNFLQRSLTTRSEAISNRNPGPPPDGGLKAWLQVLQGHLAIFNTMGYVNSYGLFVSYYVPNFHLNASDLAWPGSVQIFLFCLLATFSGRLFDSGYYRHLLLAGFSLQLLGIFSTSFSTNYWQIFLSQGVAQGIGNGLVLCPTMSLVSTYFSTHRSVAIATVASGSATGGLIFPLIAQQLFPKIGFPWGVRVMGFVMMANMAVILALARTRIPPRKAGPMLELPAFKEAPYSLFICGMFCIFLALYFAFTYINLYAKDVLGASTETSITILLVMNAIGLPGRILPAIIADAYLGPINTLIPLTFLCSFMLYVWAAVKTLHGLIAFAVIFGLVNSSVQGIFMGSMTSLTKDLSKIGTRVGMAFSILAFAALIGPPIAGQLIQVGNGSFLYTQIFGGTVTIMGTGFLFAARISETGWVLRKRM
ncbi:MFS monocarboxylate transporter [Phlyctema vagabunda]|uniref:MFS monocarboxylate transporter n=1 Tax=Phlyctema vagabunda TaxID=108571 RepID=A0ABR4PG30_9HELO